MTVKINGEFNDILIAQSDTPCSISEIPPEDILAISSNYDWGHYVFDWIVYNSINKDLKNISCNYDNGWIDGGYSMTHEFKNKLTYEVLITDIHCLTTKKYVYVEFIEYTSKQQLDNPHETFYDYKAYKFASDNPENWYEVSTVGEISAAVDAYSQVEIIIN